MTLLIANTNELNISIFQALETQWCFHGVFYVFSGIIFLLAFEFWLNVSLFVSPDLWKKWICFITLSILNAADVYTICLTVFIFVSSLSLYLYIFDVCVYVFYFIFIFWQACGDAKSKPAFLSDKSLESCIKHIVRKFPNIDSKSVSASLVSCSWICFTY